MSKRPFEQENGSPGSLQVHPIRFEELPPALNAGEYSVHRAALEWSLDAPITIAGEQDILSKREWIGRFKPYAHQIQNLITFCRRAPVTLLADDVGLGKTISAGLILCELMARRKVSKSLVIAPKLLLDQWQEELATKFNIPSKTATGSELKDAIRSRVPVIVTTYHSARSAMPAIRNADFDMLILDEAHKLRNLHGTASPPKFATELRGCLANRIFKYVLMLTATPIQNRMWDLYSLIDLMTVAKGHSNPLGSPELFKGNYLLKGSNGVHLKPVAEAEFRLQLSKYIVRTRRQDVRLLFPEREVKLVSVRPSAAEIALLDLASELFTDDSVKMNGLSKSSLGQALMSSPEAFLMQLQTMSERGTIPKNYALEAEEILIRKPTGAKLNQVLKLVKELKQARPHDWRLVIFTGRRATQDTIGAALREEGVPFGFIRGGQGTQNQRTVHDFREQPLKCRVIVSTDAGAEGVNLQTGNVLVNYDLPWNPMVVEQRIGRIQRLASKHAKVQILNLALKGSVEEHVVARLMGKLQAIAQSIGDIEAVLDSGNTDADAGTFEAMIRDLVVESLRGLDQKKAVKLQEASIAEAKRIFDEEAKTVERTLGDLRELHREGPYLPEIEPIVPSMESHVFATKALEAEGAKVTAVSPDVLEVRLPRQHPYRITFKRDEYSPGANDGVFGGNRPRQMLPGKRDFERLAQRWCDRSAAHITQRLLTEQEMRRLLQDWFEEEHAWEVLALDEESRSPVFVGDVTCRASIANSFDRLETLINIDVNECPEGITLDGDIGGPEPQMRNFTSADLGADVLAELEEWVTKEEDLQQFHDFYRERLKEELPQAEKVELKQRLAEQFACSVNTELVAASGFVSQVYRLTARIRAGELGEASLKLIVQPRGKDGWQIGLLEKLVKCERTQQQLPEPLTSICAISGMRLANSLLETSAVSGKMAERGAMLTCEETGDRLLPDEAVLCPVSGRLLRKDLTEVSGVSGRRVDRTLLIACEFTGTLILTDELETSDISNKRYRADQTQRSVTSARIGHRSEFILSVDPPGLIAVDEAKQSDVSGAWSESGRMAVSEKPPGRAGLSGEARTCEITGRRLLLDETAISCVSGKTVDTDLLVPSAMSGDLAMRDEMSTCESTGDLILPRELGRCEISGKLVRSDLLQQSAVSGQKALQTLMVRCPERKELILPEEAEHCAVTRLPTSRDRMGTCSITGRRAGRSRLQYLEDNITGYIADAISQDKTEEISGHNVLVQACPLLNKMVLTIEMKTCGLTGLFVHRSLLNDSSELHELRKLLDGVVSESACAVSKELATVLQNANPRLVRASDVQLCEFVPDRFAGVARVSRGLLRGSDIVGFVFESRSGQPLRFLSDLLLGQRRKGTWERAAT